MIPVNVVFSPDWWNRRFGISFEEPFYLDLETRIADDLLMRRALFELFGIGTPDPKPRPAIGSRHIAGGFVLPALLGVHIRFKEGQAAWPVPGNLDRDSAMKLRAPDVANTWPMNALMAQAEMLALRFGHVTGAAPLLKHFLAYNNETDRATASSVLRPRVLHEYELPVFHAPIAAGVAVGVMPSYNLVNGRPNHVSPYLERELRRWTDDELEVCSDAEAPSNLVDAEHYFADHPAGHAAALRAGVDSFTDHGEDSSVTVGRITEALERGLLTLTDVDRAVRRLLLLRLRLGELDPDLDPYADTRLGSTGPGTTGPGTTGPGTTGPGTTGPGTTGPGTTGPGTTGPEPTGPEPTGPEPISTGAHRDLARRAARQAIVLLKNDDRALPITPRPGLRIAVVGPFADRLCEDWYSGTMPYQVTIAEGLREALRPVCGEIICAEGIDRVALRTAAAGERSAGERSAELAAEEVAAGELVAGELVAGEPAAGELAAQEPAAGEVAGEEGGGGGRGHR